MGVTGIFKHHKSKVKSVDAMIQTCKVATRDNNGFSPFLVCATVQNINKKLKKNFMTRVPCRYTHAGVFIS